MLWFIMSDTTNYLYVTTHEIAIVSAARENVFHASATPVQTIISIKLLYHFSSNTFLYKKRNEGKCLSDENKVEGCTQSV